MQAGVKKLVIVGGGTAGWMTAAFMSKMMAGSIEITLVESDTIGTVGVGEATIPPILLFNKAIGIDENDFLKATQGTFKLGIEFHNWGQVGDAYLHGFGHTGHNLGMTPFHHYYFRAKQEGLTGDLWDYSLNTLAAREGKFAPMDKIPNSPVSGINYAYHFDAGLYARYLRAFTENKGVKRVEGKINEVKQNSESGHIEAVVLENGEIISGDFFVDCSGFRGLLISEALEVDYKDYKHWLPCDRAIAVQSENVGAPKPYTQSIAHSAGWQWRIPLQHRTGNGHVFSSQHMSEDEATSILMNNLEGDPVTDPKTIKFQTGRREVFWEKNCVALGLSSGFLEPLESTSIHLIQSAIIRLAKLFPKQGVNDILVEDYNRQAVAEFDYVADFIILHYFVTQRTDSDFWNYCRTMDIPDRLRRKIDLYKHMAAIDREDNELFTEGSWLHVLLGQNEVPDGYSIMADDVSSANLGEFMSNLKTIMGGALSKMPTHQDYIARYCAAKPPV